MSTLAVGLNAMVLSQLADELPVMSAFVSASWRRLLKEPEDGVTAILSLHVFHASWVNRCPLWLSDSSSG